MLAAKSYFDDAVRWLEIHGGPDVSELVAEWRALAGTVAEQPAAAADASRAEGSRAEAPRDGPHGEGNGRGGRRRRRRRRRRPRNEAAPQA
jgi:hypothetical protein